MFQSTAATIPKPTLNIYTVQIRIQIFRKLREAVIRHRDLKWTNKTKLIENILEIFYQTLDLKLISSQKISNLTNNIHFNLQILDYYIVVKI